MNSVNDIATEVREHPHDREAYAEFAHAMGWAVSWWELNGEGDIPGPGRLPFVLAFRKVRELAGSGLSGEPGVDHWGNWLREREVKRAERHKVKQAKRRKMTRKQPAGR